jgi:hypothetical protein
LVRRAPNNNNNPNNTNNNNNTTNNTDGGGSGGDDASVHASPSKGTNGGGGVGGSGIGGGGGAHTAALHDEVKKLRIMVAARDSEISVLVGMLKQQGDPVDNGGSGGGGGGGGGSGEGAYETQNTMRRSDFKNNTNSLSLSSSSGASSREAATRRGLASMARGDVDRAALQRDVLAARYVGNMICALVTVQILC